MQKGLCLSMHDAGGFPGCRIRKGEISSRRKRFKRFIAMKLLLIFTTIACLQASADSYSQTIHLSLKNVKLEKVFDEIKKQSPYYFIYTKEELQQAGVISIEMKAASIEQVLDHCLKEQPLSYIIRDNYVIIKERAVRKDDAGYGMRDVIDIKGRVVNDKDEPIEGATVRVKGSTVATSTDKDGGFVLKGVEENSILIITGAEFETKEVSVGNRQTVIARVVTKVNSLDQVLVMAYGETTKRFNTGSIAKVSAEEISKQPVSNVLAALQGRVPGLEVTATSGITGSSFNIQIRGRSSIAQGTQPLIIIDGVPFAPGNNFLNQLPSALGNPEGSLANGLSPLSFINTADIESIEILKDADATSIYGSRGANGVVLITTKRAKAGNGSVHVNFYHGISKVTRTMDLLNTSQYVMMRKEAFRNDNVMATTLNAPDLLVWDTTRYTDFKKWFIGGTAHTTDAQVSFGGGGTTTQFIFGSGYHRESTVFPGDLYSDRGSVNLHVKNSSVNKRFNTSISFNYVAGKNRLSTSDLTAYTDLPPNAPALFDVNGHLKWEEGGINFFNPLSYLFSEYAAKTENLLGHLQSEYELLRGWKIRLSGGYSSTTNREERIEPMAAQNPVGSMTAVSWFGNRFFRSWIIEPQTEFDRALFNGRIKIYAGATFQQSENESSTIQASGFVTDALIRSVGDAQKVITDNNYKQYRYNAVFGRANYTLKSRYIINVTGRRDGSSRFGPANRFANFASTGVGWIFSEEKFVKDKMKFISFGKLRGSYGTTGNDQIADYQYLDTWSGTPNPYQGVPGLMPTRLFNPNHQWEENRKLEGAIELGLFRDKIFLTGAYFRNRSSNQLINYILPFQTGFASILKNFEATVQNSGLELSIQSTNVSSSGFKWQSSFNITIARNKLVSFPGIKSSSYANVLEVGQSLNLIKKYNYLYVDSSSGIYVFEDVNKDGIYNSTNDFQVLGKTDANFYGGIGNSVSYKCWQLDLFVEFRKQTGVNYLRNFAADRMPGTMLNQPVIVLKRWNSRGDLTPIQQYSTGGNSAATTAANRLSVSDAFYSDASFIRFKNLSLSYNLPSHIIEKIKGKGCKLYVLAQNFITITHYEGADPETQNYFALPPLKTIVIGMQLNF